MNEIYWVAAGDLPLSAGEADGSPAAVTPDDGTGRSSQTLPLAQRLLAEFSQRKVPPSAVDWIWLLPANGALSTDVQTALLPAFPHASSLPLRPALEPATRHCIFAGLLRALLLGERSCALWLEQSLPVWSYVLLASHLTVGRYNLFPEARLLSPTILHLDPGRMDSMADSWLALQGYPEDTPYIAVSLEQALTRPAEAAATPGESSSPAARPSRVQTLAGALHTLLSSLEQDEATCGLLGSPLPGGHLQVLALERV